jgi:hypothetical protein
MVQGVVRAGEDEQAEQTEQQGVSPGAELVDHFGPGALVFVLTVYVVEEDGVDHPEQAGQSDRDPRRDEPGIAGVHCNPRTHHRACYRADAERCRGGEQSLDERLPHFLGDRPVRLPDLAQPGYDACQTSPLGRSSGANFFILD